MKRFVGAMAAAVVVLGSLSSGAVVSAAPGSDEDQIRDVLAAELSTLQGLDPVGYGANFCAEHSSWYQNNLQRTVTGPSLRVLADQDPEDLRSRLAKAFPAASEANIDALVTAVTDGDLFAFKEAWRALLQEEYAHTSYRLKSADVTGDTADVTVQVKIGRRSGQTVWPFVREDGEWKDCTPPPAEDSAAPALKNDEAQGLIGAGNEGE